MADWDTSNPTDNAVVAQYPANERAARTALVSNFAVDHYSTNDANVGKHTVVRLLEQSAQTATAGEGKLYAVDTAARSELFWLSDTGSPIQITSGANGLLVNASNILSGSLPDARLSANVPLLNAANAFTAAQLITVADEAVALRLRGATGGLRFRPYVASGTRAILEAVNIAEDAFINLTINADAVLALSATAVTLNGVAASDFARLSQSNTFTGTTQTLSSIRPSVRLTETDAAADAGRWNLEAQDGALLLETLSDAGGSGTALLLATRTGNAATLALTGTTLTLNSINVTDFARLSQSNTFAANQVISKSGSATDFTLQTTSVHPSRLLLETNSSLRAIIGASSGTNSIITGDVLGDLVLRVISGGLKFSGDNGSTVHFSVSSGGAAVFGGAVTAATISASDSETLVAGQLHFIDANATLPNLTGGQWIQVVNHSASPITISKNASDTTYWCTTGAEVSTSFTLASRGRLTATAHPGGEAVFVSGSGITGAT